MIGKEKKVKKSAEEILNSLANLLAESELTDSSNLEDEEFITKAMQIIKNWQLR